MLNDALRRRDVLAGAGALAVLPACVGPAAEDSAQPAPTPLRPPEPAAWAAPGTEDAAAFAWGVQVTDVTSAGALVSCRSLATSPRLVLVRAQGEQWVDERVVESLSVVADVARVELTDLAPDTAYSLVVEGDTGRSPVCRFRTALDDTGWRVLVLGASSCLGRDGAPWASLSHAADHALDLFLLLGDTVYADGATDYDSYRSYWGAALSTDGLRDLALSTSLVATWDDHEVTNNWSWDTAGMDLRYADALAAFEDALPHRPSAGGGAFWRSQRWGRVAEVFVLDCRSERIGGRYLSEEQTEWFVSSVLASSAVFKVVLTSVPIADMYALFAELEADDAWRGFAEERTSLLERIRGVTGVLFVSGDIHMGFVAAVDRAGGPGEGLWEVCAGPAGSDVNPIGVLKAPDEQFIVVNGLHCWARLELDPGAGTCKVAFVGNDGVAVDEVVLQLA